MSKTVFILILGFGLVWTQGTAQNNLTTVTENVIARQIYQANNVATPLTGQAYTLKELYAVNNPLYLEAGPDLGELTYDGIYYNDQVIQFDMFLNQVILLLKSSGNVKYVSLDTDKVSSFAIADKDFVNLESLGDRPQGIYESGYVGHSVSLYIKRQVNRHETASGYKEIKYLPNHEYYIDNEFGSFRITNKSSLKKAFGNTARIKSLMRKYSVSLSSRNRELSLLNFVGRIDEEYTDE